MLQPIRAKMDGLNTLQLEDNTFKDTLQALVKTHFMQRLGQETNHFEYDIVRGKGRGLVILLHGAPGTGKTLTAESIAAATGQPLLQVTCGDLGLKPKEVDSALKEIFHLASHWKCVLLLDECDIFLTQRNRADVKRNALVSVFLRVLEFYTGVLFLTTNRVGALDEAINSRITWIMDYPPLNWAQTEEIWKTNLSNVKKGNKKLRVDGKGILAFAEDQFYETEDLKNASWNGRRIQNAFKVAVALAYWETYTNDERGEAWLANTNASKHKRRATLTAAHFQSYAASAAKFDSYRMEAIGGTDGDRAFQAMDRADDFNVPTLLAPDEPRRISTTPSARSPVVRASTVTGRVPTAHYFQSQQQPQQGHNQMGTSYGAQDTWANASHQPRVSRRKSSTLSQSGPLSPPAGRPRRTTDADQSRSAQRDFGGQDSADQSESDTDSEDDEAVETGSGSGTGSEGRY
jgi:SpoVK/Ycf46/Vps4 family AAA+-type ATPase